MLLRDDGCRLQAEHLERTKRELWSAREMNVGRLSRRLALEATESGMFPIFVDMTVSSLRMKSADRC